MAVELTKGKRVLFLVTILLAASIQMSDFVVYPIMNEWFVTYADQIGLVNYAMTGSLVGMFFGALVSGKAAQFVSKRVIMLVGTLLFIVGGAGIMLTDSILVICVLRTISGFAFGACSVATYALINELYEDEDQRSKIIGYFGAAMSAWGVILGMLSGYIATINIKGVYALYLIGVVLLVLEALYIPDTGIERATADGDHGQMVSNMAFPLVSIVAISLAVAFAAVGGNAPTYEVSILVDQLGIGDTVFSGTLTSVYTFASFLFTLVFGIVYNKLKRYTSLIGYACTAVGNALLWLNPSVPTYLIGFALSGIGWGCLLAYYPMHIGTIVPANRQSMAIGIFNAAWPVGGFLCTYIVTLLCAANGTDQVVAAFPAISAVMGVATVLTVILGIRFTRAHTDDAIASA